MGRLYTQVLSSLLHTHAHTHTLLLCMFEIPESQAKSNLGAKQVECLSVKLLIKPLKWFLSFTFTPEHVIWD